MTAYFVTGVGTEIGKTYVSCALLKAKRAEGAKVRAVKPLMSGFDPDDIESSDAGQLIQACGLNVNADTLADVCAHSFVPPVAPNLAARQAGVSLEDGAILQFIRARLASDAFTLVEGAGGVLSPVTDTLNHAGLIAALNLPAIVVGANYLGAISHTLSALEALDKRGIPIAAMVVSQPTPDAPPPQALIEEISRFRAAPYVSAPFGADPQSLGANVAKTIGAAANA
ncbi:MAG: dethiobiotin synthase [Pseudomonadota bacterium]